MENFWKYNKDSNPYVKQHLVVEFLEHNGFRNTKINGQWQIVRIDSHIVEFIPNTIAIRQILTNHIQESNDLEGKSTIMDKTLDLFKNIRRNGLIDALRYEDLNLIEGDKKTAYKFFRNCAVRIIAKKIEILKYSELKGNVLRDSIIDKDFFILEDKLIFNSDFPNFLFRCMNCNEDNYFALMSVLGYLSNSYKSKKDNKAVIFCDENSEDVGEGGTGKTVTAEALGYFNKTLQVDGKNFKFSNFTFQQMELGTKLFVIDDASKKFNFEQLFSSITCGIEVEKKYQDRYLLSFEDSPKILITTNYTIFGRGFSFERRIVEIEFSDYYGRNKKPFIEFNSEFFLSWENNDWNLFYNFMIQCVQLYLQGGTRGVTIKDFVLKKLRRETSRDFVDFVSDYEFKNWIRKSDLFGKFIEEFPDYKKWLTIRTFNNWLRIYFSTMNIEYQEAKKDGGQRCWVFNA